MTRGDDLLRHDRDQPGELPDRPSTIRSSGASRTVGRVHPHVEVKIVDAEGRIVPPGAPGELCTRGYSVMLGYWDDPEQDRRGHRRGRLDAHRRSRHHRRRGLLQHRRPHQGHGDPRRRERLSARDRGVPLPPSRRSQDVQVFGVPDHEIRRGAVRLDHAASRARPRAPRRSAASAAARSPTTRSRATSASSTSSR